MTFTLVNQNWLNRVARYSIWTCSWFSFIQIRYVTNLAVQTPPVATKRTRVGGLCASATACSRSSSPRSTNQPSTRINGDFSPILTGTLIASEITGTRPTGTAAGMGWAPSFSITPTPNSAVPTENRLVSANLAAIRTTTITTRTTKTTKRPPKRTTSPLTCLPCTESRKAIAIFYCFYASRPNICTSS